MSYYQPRGSRRPSTRLTPPADLVGKRVRWRGKTTSQTHFGTVESYDAEARTLVIRVSQAVSYWEQSPYRDVVIPLSSGPFTLA